MPRPICRSLCELLLQDCAIFLGGAFPAPNCTALPDNGYNVITGSGVEFVPCVGGSDFDPSLAFPGSCELWDEEPARCSDAGLDDQSSVFVTTGVTQSDIAAAISTSVSLIGLAPEPCQSSALEFVCSTSFSECTNLRDGFMHC